MPMHSQQGKPPHQFNTPYNDKHRLLVKWHTKKHGNEQTRRPERIRWGWWLLRVSSACYKLMPETEMGLSCLSYSHLQLMAEAEVAAAQKMMEAAEVEMLIARDGQDFAKLVSEWTAADK